MPKFEKFDKLVDQKFKAINQEVGQANEFMGELTTSMEEILKAMGISAFVMNPIVMNEIANTIREVLDNK